MQWQLAVAIVFTTELCFFIGTSAHHDPECTPPLFFKCHGTDKCISHVFVCDGDDDCGDDSDENPQHCSKELPSFVEACKEHEFQCGDRFHCIAEDDYCDGKKDCIDGSDEIDDCHLNKTCNGFKCASGQCIQKSWVCDDVKDCRDGSDETNCTSRYNVLPVNCNSTIDKYLCANGQRCIDLGLVCNNVDDCGDDSDEHPINCAKAVESCRSSPCSSVCRPTPKGYQCACAAGYILKNDSCQELTKRKHVAIAAGKTMVNYYDEPLVTSNVTLIIVACTQEQYRCHDGTCIELNLVCNGRNDCDDFSDEANCNDHDCNDRSFRCTNGFCIPGNWECDGQADCTDNSDEHESCMPPIPCALGTFSCRNGRCVHENLECNGIDDCHDNSDEEDCAVEAFNCTDNQYRCKNSYMCIHENLKCNGKVDCPKRDDEESCGRFSDSLFKCGNGQSIPREWVCNSDFDCDDKSDEKNCSARSRSTVNCTETQFACKTGHCISLTNACNGVDDCSDGSDEDGSCGTACLENFCEVVCHRTPNGGVCGCSRGYKLAADGKKCVSVDECEPGVCSQHCTNRSGSVVCSCYDGYLLRLDKVSCKATGPVMKIWTVRSDEIRIVVPNKPRNPVEVLFHDPGIYIHGLDVNAIDETVYWSNGDLGIISKISVNKSNLTRASDDLGRPQVLVVDWITDNVYVYDAKPPANIKVCNIETNKCSVLISRDGPKSQVTAMAINPIAEYLFFGQTFSHSFKSSVVEIVRTNLIGSNEISIVQGNIGIVNGIAVDHQRSVIYWIDGYNSVIECVDFNGEGREIVFEGLPLRSIGLFLFEDSLYWKSDFGQTLYKLALYGDGRKALTEVIDGGNVHQPFVVSQMSMQPNSTNLCANNNCTHLCVIHEGRPTCLCREGTPARLRKNTACPGETIFESSKTTNVCSAGNMNLWFGLVCGLLVVAMFLGMCYFCLTTKRPNRLYRPNFENVDGIRLSKWRINDSTTSTTSNSVWTTGRVFC